MSGTTSMMRPVARLLGEVTSERSLFTRSTLSMTVFQVATAATAGLSTGIATAVIGDAETPVVAAMLIGLVAAVAAVATFTWIESWLSHVLAYRVIDQLRMRVYDAVERIVPQKTGIRRAGEVGGTAMNDVEALEWFYAHTLGAGINAVVSPVIVSIVLISMVGPIGLIVPAGIALFLAIPWLLASVQLRQGADIRVQLGKLQAVAFEGAEAQRELATLNLTEQHRTQVLTRTKSLQAAKRRFALRAAAESAFADVVVAATSLGFLVALMNAAASGAVSPNLLPAALVLVAAAVAPAAGAFAMMQRLGEISSAAQRVLDFIDDGGTKDQPGVAAARDGAGGIQVDNVTFAYGTNTVLRDLSFEIAPGQTVALVGASGAGKTTIARLLTRLWEPSSGSIILDGAALDSLDVTSLRRQVALVSQHPFIFRGTVRSNLELAAPDASEKQMWSSLRDAGLADTIAAWPDGLDERVGDRGATMSGGQRQRLSIAQVLLRDPAVLILDEASAQLDAVLELNLAAAVARLRRGRTTIVIAHRVSTIRRAERVLVIADGRIVGDGAHEDLMDRLPYYRQLLAGECSPHESPAASTTRVEPTT